MLQALLRKGGSHFVVLTRAEASQDFRGWLPSAVCTHVVRVLPGYRAHFEAEFDKDGNILSIGQWEEL